MDRRTRASRRYRELCKEMFVMRQTVAGIARVPPVARERGGFSPPAQDGIHSPPGRPKPPLIRSGEWPTKAAMTRTPFLFAVISLALLATEIPAGAAVRLDRAERAAIRHINAFRAAHGRPPVHPARSLNRSAEAHSTDMARRNFFAHNSSDGTPFDVRIRRYIGRGAGGRDARVAHPHAPHRARRSCGCGSTPRRTARSCSGQLPPRRRRPPPRHVDGRFRVPALAARVRPAGEVAVDPCRAARGRHTRR